MPYAPGIEYRGGDYLYGGIMGAARGLVGGLEDWQKKHDETQQKLQESGVLMDYAQKKGYVTPEQFTKYISANANQKADMASALAKTIALDQHDAEQKAALQNAIDVAKIHAAAAGGGRAGQRGPATVEELAYAQNYAPPGYSAVPTPTGWQLVGKDPGMAKTTFHKPGDPVPDPTDPSKTIGLWQKDDEIKYFAEVDPQKKMIADEMKKYSEQQDALKAAQAAAAGGGGVSIWHPSTWFGGGATPAPTPAVTPGPVIAPVATPTYPPVAPQGATVSPAPQLSAQDQQALAWAQANPNDPRAAAIRQKLGY